LALVVPPLLEESDQLEDVFELVDSSPSVDCPSGS
jgi:hypothetical protein